MKKIVTLVLFLVAATSSLAQKKEKKNLDPLANRPGWYEGTVLLADGSELTGELRYNDQIGILSFRNDTEDTSFSPRSVSAFNFL